MAAAIVALGVTGSSVLADGPPPVQASVGAAAPTPVMAEAYARAERFLRWNASRFVRNAHPEHHWMNGRDRFWYARESGDGTEISIVDAATGARRLAFDSKRIAAGLTRATGVQVDDQRLRFTDLSFADDERAIRFLWRGREWRCVLENAVCAGSALPASRPGELVSPDGKLAAFVRDYDLWVRSIDDGQERRLTTDGHEHYAYGSLGEAFKFVTFRRQGVVLPPVAAWSPDSKRLVVQRTDEREVGELHLVQSSPDSGSARPVEYSFRSALPGDEHVQRAELYILDVTTGSRIAVQHAPLIVSNISALASGQVWWSHDGQQVYLLPDDTASARGKRQELLAVSGSTGMVKTLIVEESDTFVNAGPSVVSTLSSGAIIWYSERDGWGHLYRYDRNGRLINRITSGEWQVREIVRVDEPGRRIYFTAGGREPDRNPYLRHLYSVKFDGSGLRLLTPEDGDHRIVRASSNPIDPSAPKPEQLSFSPSGRFFVDTYSRVDLPPTTVVRDAGGRLISTIERADISALQAGGFRAPESFSVLAADGATRLYGVLYRPSNFDPGRRYPVLDAIYPGPQRIGTYHGFMDALFSVSDMQCLAELGFIVVTMDARGTPLRSKAFLDYTYGRMGRAGLEDHVAALKQLASRYPYIDLDRAGIYGHSAGGFAAARAIFTYPDFFKVAVASSGTHNLQTYYPGWGGTFQGPYTRESYAEADNNLVAANLKGKLLLMHGELDDNVNPALTMQLVAALIRANRDFDMLIVPNAGHLFEGSEAYFARRRWDYFVEHLAGATPPANYPIAGPK